MLIPKERLRRDNRVIQTVGKKVCNNCLQEKDINDFPISRCSSDGRRGDCRSCHSIKSYAKQIEKKAKLYPDNYFQCDDCDYIFSVYTKGRRRFDGNNIKNTNCPKCGSEEIYTFKEMEGGL